MTVTLDATSGLPIPQSLVEVADLLAGTGIANPLAILGCQDASGSVLDLSGNGKDFGASDTVLYRQTVPGWASKAIGFTSGVDGMLNGNFTPGSSLMVLAWIKFPAHSTTNYESLITFGGNFGFGTEMAAELASGDLLVCKDATHSATASPSPVDGNVHLVLMQHDKTNLQAVLQTELGTTQPSFVSGAHPSGTDSGFVRFGGQFAFYWHPPAVDILWAAVWEGSDAEIDSLKRGALIARFTGAPIVEPVGKRYWGPHFPDYVGRSHFWGPHFPDGVPAGDLVRASGPPTVATFALDLEAGATLTLTWETDVFKTYSGIERRAAKLDLPKRRITGQAFMVGDDTRVLRSRFARYAALGKAFLLGLPFEGVTLTDDTATAVVPVTSTTLIDWAVQGQRVIVTPEPGSFSQGVIQSATSSSVTLDYAPGVAVGVMGAKAMPGVAVFLDPMQGVARYPNPDGIERWSIDCYPVQFGYETEERAASANLSQSTGALASATISSATAGAAGNALSLELVGDVLTGPGHLDSGAAPAYVFHFHVGGTSVAALMSSLSALFVFGGTFVATDYLQAGDAIGPVQLEFGADQDWGEMGVGSSINEWLGRPIWDRGILVEETGGDSVQSLTQIVDLGGVPISVGGALISDWGRDLIARGDLGEPWQWLKLFLYTVCGRQKAWWLPTYREDLTPVSCGDGELMIVGPTEESGDFFAWYPTLRSSLRVQLDDGTSVYAYISNAVNNLDGTITLTILDAVGGSNVDLTGATIEMVSWLELCRFESDEFSVSFGGSVFSMSTQARVVQQ